MHLIVVLRRTDIITEEQGYHRDQIGKPELDKILPEADDKGHDQEVRKEEEVFPRPQSLHIVHDHQVQVQVHDGHQPGDQVFSSEVEMIRDDEDIGGRKVDQRADIQTKTEIGDNTDEVSDEDEKDKLVEPDRLFPFRRSIVFPETGIDDVLIEGLNKYEWVAHRIRIRVFLPPYT